MTDKRFVEISSAAGLTSELAARPEIASLIVRVVEAEDAVRRSGEVLVDTVIRATANALNAQIATTAVGAPLYATGGKAALFDYALVQLHERRTALALATQAITGLAASTTD